MRPSTHVVRSGQARSLFEWPAMSERSESNGGASRDRTDDLLNANQALSQLSYGPKICLRDRDISLERYLPLELFRSRNDAIYETVQTL